MDRAAQREPRGRFRRRVPGSRRHAASAAVLVLVLGACTQGEPSAGPTEPAGVSQERATDRLAESQAAEDAETHPRPVRVEVPAIGVDAELVDLGLNPDGSMEVPDFGLGGWYAEGPKPGAPGPAVVAAHYDSAEGGPDVFHRLQELAPGDEVHVHRVDGSTATFTIERPEQHPKEELPGERIWKQSEEPLLRLVTCGGVFDQDSGSYEDNVIAYATHAQTAE